VVVISSRTL